MKFYLHGRPPELDRSLTGVTFVDVLFALAAGQALAALTNIDQMTSISWTRFSLAIVLVMTSWVGYHMSHNRPQWAIHFFNRPLVTFVFDVLLVGLYWLMALNVRGASPLSSGDSALPESLIVVAVFVLYVAWDTVAWTMKKDTSYRRADKEMKPDQLPRRVVTMLFLGMAAVAAAVTWHWRPTSPNIIVLMDLLLVALLLTYRVAKELVTPPPGPAMHQVPRPTRDNLADQ